MNLTQIIESDLRNNLNNLNKFILMGEKEASQYIREMVSCLTDEQEIIMNNKTRSTTWNKAVDIQMDYIIRFKSVYGKDFSEVLI